MVDEKGHHFQDPFKEQKLTLKLVPIENLTVVPHQRKPSIYHVKHLLKSIERLGFIIPVVAIPKKEADHYLIIDGQHRFLAAKELGIQKLPVIVVPKSLAPLMMNFNIEKELNIREKSQVSLAIYREHLKTNPNLLETEPELIDSIENAYYVTCGIAYERESKFSGSIFESLLKKSDFFLDLPLEEAIKIREQRADKLGYAYRLIREIAQRLKELDRWHPYIYQQIMSWANPYKKKRLPADFDDLFQSVITNLEKLKKNPELIFT